MSTMARVDWPRNRARSVSGAAVISAWSWSWATVAASTAERRAASLAALDACRLQPADLYRRGRHPELGPVTVRQLLATWVAHDFDHLMQVTRVLGRQFSDEVGPWRAYLRVVSGQPG